MKKTRDEKSDELTVLVKKALQNADSVSKDERKRMKKLLTDPTILVDVMQNIDPGFTVPAFPVCADTRTEEDCIADNYIALAKFAIEKLQLKNVHKLQAKKGDCGFILYALTPAPVELDIEQFATSDYPDNKELLLEAQALQSDLFMEDSTEQWIRGIISRIEKAVL